MSVHSLLCVACLLAPADPPPAGATAEEIAARYLAGREPLTAAATAAAGGGDPTAAIAAVTAVKAVRDFEAAALDRAATDLPADDPRRDAVLDALRTELLGSHGWLAERREAVEDWTAAEASLASALALTEATRGPDDWRTGDARRAVEHLRRRRDLTDDRRADLAEAEREGAAMIEDDRAGRYEDAAVHQRARLALLEQVWGDRHPDTLQVLGDLGSLLMKAGQFDEARSSLERALAGRREVLGPRHPHTARTLRGMGQLAEETGRFGEAARTYREALAIRSETLGPRSILVAGSLDDLAGALQGVGDYPGAREALEQALEIRRTELGPDHIEVAKSLNNLAALLIELGDYVAARAPMEQALAIVRKEYGPRHPITAALTNNLARTLWELGERDAAGPMFEEYLEVTRAARGPRHPETAQALNNLANYRSESGDLDAARALHEEALAVRREALGPDHPATAESLNNLGVELGKLGRYEQAVALREESLGITRRTHGPNHPSVAFDLAGLAMSLQDAGRPAEARGRAREAVRLSLDQLAAVAVDQDDREGRITVAGRRVAFDFWLSLSADGAAAAAEALAWKGQGMSRRLARTRLPDTPELAAAKADLRRVGAELAALAPAAPAGEGARAAWRGRLDELTADRNRLDRALSAASADYRLAVHVAPADLAAALPAATAVVDFHVYRHRTPAAGGGRAVYEPRLTAFLHRRGADPLRVDLGAEAPIAGLVDDWRAAVVAGADPAAVETIGRELRVRLWEPLAPHLAGADAVLVSPDGSVCRFPPGALPGEAPGSYLIEETALATVPAPRLLPLLLAGGRAEIAGTVLVAGGVDYDAGETAAEPLLAEQATDPPAESPADPPPGVSVASRAPRGAFGAFAPLDGTGPEARAVAARAGAAGLGATALLGAGATEAAVRRLAQPAAGRPGAGVLHLATHGYFAPPDLRSLLAPRDLGADETTGLMQTERDLAGYAPGLLSGLALAGANRAGRGVAAAGAGSGRTEPAGTDDGILTAEEVAGLDLADCRLAVLSACETGLGETAGGEGLLGLQRSFQAAGAGAAVASQWAVPDEPTRVLMDRFYANLWERRLPTLDALREAQLWVLNHPAEAGADRGLTFAADGAAPSDRRDAPADRPARSHPRAWAGWSLSGDWR